MNNNTTTAETYLVTEAAPQRMAKLKLNLVGAGTTREYFADVAARLAKIGVSQGALARELGMDAAQMSRYFTDDDPNPTMKTIVAIEEAIVTLRRRKAQEK